MLSHAVAQQCEVATPLHGCASACPADAFCLPLGLSQDAHTRHHRGHQPQVVDTPPEVLAACRAVSPPPSTPPTHPPTPPPAVARLPQSRKEHGPNAARGCGHSTALPGRKARCCGPSPRRGGGGIAAVHSRAIDRRPHPRRRRRCSMSTAQRSSARPPSLSPPRPRQPQEGAPLVLTPQPPTQCTQSRPYVRPRPAEPARQRPHAASHCSDGSRGVPGWATRA
jgi:hypothetical protein